MPEKITAIIPTLNEELHIKEAIKSVSFANEIIVIDSFSNDKTVEIAKKLNVRLIQRKFDNFSSQKNYAINLANNPWIYILDADERVSKSLRDEILHTVKENKKNVGFYIYRTYFFLGNKVKHGGWQSDKVIRLFKKDKCKYNGNLVHEVIDYNGEVGFLKNRIDHFSYQDYDQYVNKLNHYAALQAKELAKSNQKVNIFHITIKPAFRFFVHYIIRLGFLDGVVGYTLASLHAYGVFTRYVKLWSLNKNKK